MLGSSWRSALEACVSVVSGSGASFAPPGGDSVDRRARGLRPAEVLVGGFPHRVLRSSRVIRCRASSGELPGRPQDAGADAHQSHAATGPQLLEHG